VESGWAANTHKFFQAQDLVEDVRVEHTVILAQASRRNQVSSKEKVAEALASLQRACRELDEQTTILVRWCSRAMFSFLPSLSFFFFSQ
jgi:hypothetical protein